MSLLRGAGGGGGGGPAAGGAGCGAAGEDLAAAWYEANGYRILARNWRCREGEIDLVSEADLVAESIIVERLRDAFPGDRVVAEEGGGHGDDSERVWYVDPLDGTTNFAHGFPQFAVSIGLADAS